MGRGGRGHAEHGVGVSGGGSVDDSTAQLLAATRRRSARINLLVDLIPARHYLPGEAHEILKAASTLDPARAKSTSQLVAEAALAAEGTPSASSKTKAQAVKKKKNGNAAATGGTEIAAADARSRLELREKLERRIVELREERRQKQSAADKAKAAEIRAKRAEEGTLKAPEQRKRQAPGEGSQGPASKLAKTKSGKAVAEESAVEAGQLIFEPSSKALPFEASVGRRGAKVKELRKALREEQEAQRKLTQAESEGRGDEVRKELAMQKALARARGEKVHDDVTKLRKTQKLMDKKKVKGKEAWESRVAEAKRLEQEKQQTRKDNLQAKRNSKRKNKGKSGRDGFEGKHSGYLNKEE